MSHFESSIEGVYLVVPCKPRKSAYKVSISNLSISQHHFRIESVIAMSRLQKARLACLLMAYLAIGLKSKRGKDGSAAEPKWNHCRSSGSLKFILMLWESLIVKTSQDAEPRRFLCLNLMVCRSSYTP